MHIFFLLTLAFVPLLAASQPRLWYAQPAAKWEEALPIGSGRLGAMVFGGTTEERIQFNEDTLWTGKPHNYVRAGADKIVPEVRRLLAAGEVKASEDLARAKMLSDPVRQKAYQPFGDLRLHFPGHDKTSHYRRELDLDAAIARTSYEVDGITYTREVFASYPDNVIVVHLTASKPGALSFTLRMDSPHKESQTVALNGGGAPSPREASLSLTGRIQADGLRFESRVRTTATGGKIHAEGNALVIEQADSATLTLVAATSFQSFEAIDADPTQRCIDYLSQLGTRDHAQLLATHTADHQKVYRRVSLDLGHTAAADLPTDERLRHAQAAKNIDADPALAALEFNYGRYLLIASSRPGTQPANLQGIWNELLNPPWESKYTTNINFEMNYWLAELTGLKECHEPLFAAVDDLRISGARTAQQLYHSRGWVLHHNFDLWRGTAPINNIDGIWPTGGAWLCHHLWEHWLFTRDRTFLTNRAYPAMKESSLFFIDFLVPDPKTGWLLSSPSHSPEQGGTVPGPTMDNQLIRWVWTATIEAARELGTDENLVAELEKLLPKLPPNQIGRHGQLQEWIADIDVPNNNHRHMSPLWALYPGADINPADPKLFAAAKTLLKWRGPGSTGWSYAWRIPLWARVGDGDYAYSQLSDLLVKRTLPNLFDLCGPFQIDGNFGATAGIVEMLLQSHQRSIAPQSPDPKSTTPEPKSQIQEPRPQNPDTIVIIDLLPALPKIWPQGSVTGLHARDGFVVNLAWADGVMTRVTIHATVGRPALVRTGGQEISLQLTAGQSVTLDTHLRPITQ